MGPKIHWVQNYVTDDKIYCLYIAPDEETVRAHAQRGGFPANAVARVRAVLITLHDFCEMACNSGRGSFPTPGWPQSLRCFDDRRHAHHRSGCGRLAVAADHACLHGDRDLLAWPDAFPAAIARNDVISKVLRRFVPADGTGAAAARHLCARGFFPIISCIYTFVRRRYGAAFLRP
jgi:Nickel responsive protein SCO4226-like